MPKVLIVDDEPAYCTLLSRLLSRQAFDVHVASDAHGAISVASIHRPDVVIADWMLRDFHDGLDLLYALRQAGISCPVIMMSGYPSEQLRGDASDSGVFHFLAKPFEPEELIAVVKRATSEPPMTES